ncbi:helix-turn-helix domain-containing protein [Rhizobium rhizogenes]|uniref:helix-turn-helix domain-containing protein n=1 Tax=Rhizobium rhizogenes TaxID=359 RepID=UPI0015734944|nr:helix-turn-helix transcriptional regulator [Rhizobium rhizogenes]NTF97861.1 helix-turn-helix transcriptional regulator [Rhizobium rhizogenes]
MSKQRTTFTKIRRHKAVQQVQAESNIHPVDVYVGQQIRIQRVRANLSQTELGKGAGISYQQVQKYEVGTNRVSASMLWEIANVLNVPAATFFDGLPESGAGDPTQISPQAYESLAFIATTEGRELVERLTDLTPQARRRLLLLLNALVQA